MYGLAIREQYQAVVIVTSSVLVILKQYRISFLARTEHML